MRKRSSVSPHGKPYRVAVVIPRVTIEGPDVAYEREAALLLWAACVEGCHRHPQLAVADVSAPFVHRDGHFAPERGAEAIDLECLPLHHALCDDRYVAARRDDIIGLELSLGSSSGGARLHSATRDGTRRAFEATGRNVGEQIRDVFAAWLSARGLDSAPLVFDAITGDDILAAVRIVAPPLSDPTPHSLFSSAVSLGNPPSGTLPGGAGGVEVGRPPRIVVEQLAPSLRAPAVRVIELAFGSDQSAALRATDPDHPRARLAALRADSQHGETIALVHRLIDSAPGWDRPYVALLALHDADDHVRLEAVAAAGMAMVCRPNALDVLEAAADRLSRAGRFDEALRIMERGLRLHQGDRRAHLALLRTFDASDRLGARLAQAMVALRQQGCPSQSDVTPEAEQIEVDLRVSSALASVGRLDEAIALRAHRLLDRESAWPGQARLLERWRNEPRFVAQAYAREAFFRGDVARVLEGFARTPPADSVDLAMLLDSLVAAGLEYEAPLAWGQFGLGYGHRAPVARLAAVTALVAAGHHRRGLEELWRVELTAPSNSDATAIARCGVMLAGVPLEVAETAVDERMACGAVTLARRLARIVADYVPAAATSAVVERALGKRTAIEFDPAWLSGFAAFDAGQSTGPVDQLFIDLGPLRTAAAAEVDAVAELARGDRLVTTWFPAVSRAAASDDPYALAPVVAYTAAQALARYLAATTYPATPIAGALRTVAAEALQWLHAHNACLADEDVRGVLVSLEPLLRRIDRWVGAAWLATVERCVAVDERAAGDLGGFVRDLPTVGARILGPEETALLSWSIVRLHRERRDGWAAKVAAQAARLAMHTGSAGLDEWADAIATQLAERQTGRSPHSRDGGTANAGAAETIDLDDAIDALLTACYLAEGVTAGPCVYAALTLFHAGRAQTAFEVLAAGFATASARGEAWRTQQLAVLRDAWLRANLDVPFDLTEGSAPLFETLRNRDPVHAERLGQWAVAFDPGDLEAHRNLGLALAGQGNTVDAMAHLARATRDQAAELLVVALNKAGYLDDAKTVLGYANRWATEPPVWPAAMPTRERALARESVGDDTAQQHTSVRKTARASSPTGPVVAARRGGDNALAFVTEPDVAIPLHADETVATPAAASALADLRLALDDPRAVAERLTDPSWRVRCAALGALRFRTNAENYIAVPPGAERGAVAMLAETEGTTDFFARLTRALALHVRKQAHFARDPLPELGDRMTRAAFDREFRLRSGEVVADVPTPELVDRVVCPSSAIARISDYVALLRDLAHLPPDEALAQFDLDAASYLEVAREWATAMAADPTIQVMVERSLAKR